MYQSIRICRNYYILLAIKHRYLNKIVKNIDQEYRLFVTVIGFNIINEM